MATITFNLVTPERSVFTQVVDRVTVPPTRGYVTILPNHMALVALLQPGEIVAHHNDQELAMAVSGGFLEVSNNQVTVLAQTAERAEELDEQRAVEARQKATDLLETIKHRDSVEFARVAAQLEKELARLRVVRKRSHSKS